MVNLYDYSLRYNNKTKCYYLCKTPIEFNCNCPPGPKGKTGNGIFKTVDNNDGTFTFYYTNGTTFTTSDLTGPQGPQGPSGSDFYIDYSISPIITSNTYTININNDYDIYQIDTSLNPIQFYLPQISSLTNNKRIYNIVDVGGNLNSNQCIINIFNSDKLLNIINNTLTMNTNYSSFKLCSNTVDNWIIL